MKKCLAFKYRSSVRYQWFPPQKKISVPLHVTYTQWHNSRGEGGQSSPLILLTGKFLLTHQEKRGKERGRGKKKNENGEEKKGNWKRKVGNWKWKKESYKTRRGLLFFFFTFQYHWNLFLVYQYRNFLPGKSISCLKIRENGFAPSENIPLMPLPTYSKCNLFYFHKQQILQS